MFRGHLPARRVKLEEAAMPDSCLELVPVAAVGGILVQDALPSFQILSHLGLGPMEKLPSFKGLGP